MHAHFYKSYWVEDKKAVTGETRYYVCTICSISWSDVQLCTVLQCPVANPSLSFYSGMWIVKLAEAPRRVQTLLKQAPAQRRPQPSMENYSSGKTAWSFLFACFSFLKRWLLGFLGNICLLPKKFDVWMKNRKSPSFHRKFNWSCLTFIELEGVSWALVLFSSNVLLQQSCCYSHERTRGDLWKLGLIPVCRLDSSSD